MKVKITTMVTLLDEQEKDLLPSITRSVVIDHSDKWATKATVDAVGKSIWETVLNMIRTV